MNRSSSIFFKIPVTIKLVQAVKLGQYPAAPTTVFGHIPDLPQSSSEGMRPLDNRFILLQCYGAFEEFI